MVGVLARLEALDEVLDLGAPPLTREFYYSDGGTEPVEGPPQDPGAIGYCLSVRREPLDVILVERARGTDSFDFVERANVTSLLCDEELVSRLKLGQARSARADVVVGADGPQTRLRRQKHLAPATEHESPPVPRALLPGTSPGLPGPGRRGARRGRVLPARGRAGHLFPSDSGYACVAVSVNLASFRWLRRDVGPRFAERIARHRGLAARVAAAAPEGRVLGGGPERSFVRVPWGPGWALVGDAAMHQDPWTGLGIDMAGVHATFLAEAIVDWLRGPADEPTALARYHERRNAHALELFHYTVGFARDLRTLPD